MPWKMLPRRGRTKFRCRGECNELDRKTIQVFKASWQFSALNFIPSETCRVTAQKNCWPKWGEVANMQRGFFWFGGSLARESRNLGYIFAGSTGMDGFPMTWKRNNPLFVRKSAFHILYRSFPELPHHGIILQSSKHDLLYSIVAVFQWPEREKHSICISQIWSNIFWLILSPPWYYIAKFQIWSIICNCYQVTFLTSSPRKFEKWSYSQVQS